MSMAVKADRATEGMTETESENDNESESRLEKGKGTESERTPQTTTNIAHSMSISHPFPRNEALKVSGDCCDANGADGGSGVGGVRLLLNKSYIRPSMEQFSKNLPSTVCSESTC